LPVTILLDLPGPKIRVGALAEEPMILQKGESVTLVPAAASDDPFTIPVDFEQFPQMVSPGSTIYLGDGFLQVQVEEVGEREKASGPGKRYKPELAAKNLDSSAARR